MPDILAASALATTADGVLIAGFLEYRKRLYARITSVAANNWTLYDEAGNASTITGSSTDPTYIRMITLRIDKVLTGGTNADVMKVGASATDTGGYIVNTTAVASNQLAIQNARLAVAPTAPVALTADLTLGLFLHNGSNLAPGGTLALPTTDTEKQLIVPVEVHYAKRPTAPRPTQVNLRLTDAKSAAGITW